MTRPRNIQHGQERRRPPGILCPLIIIGAATSALVWEMCVLFGVVIG